MKNFSTIGRNMMIADKYFKLYLRDALQPYGLNASDGIVLLMMYQTETKHNTEKVSEETNCGSTQDELIREIHYDKGVMTRTMKELEQKGYVLREPNPKDSRSYIFTLTKLGQDFKHTLISILQDWNNELLSNLKETDLAVVEAALDIMAKNTASYYGKIANLKKRK